MPNLQETVRPFEVVRAELEEGSYDTVVEYLASEASVRLGNLTPENIHAGVQEAELLELAFKRATDTRKGAGVELQPFMERRATLAYGILIRVHPELIPLGDDKTVDSGGLVAALETTEDSSHGYIEFVLLRYLAGSQWDRVKPGEWTQSDVENWMKLDELMGARARRFHDRYHLSGDEVERVGAARCWTRYLNRSEVYYRYVRAKYYGRSGDRKRQLDALSTGTGKLLEAEDYLARRHGLLNHRDILDSYLRNRNQLGINYQVLYGVSRDMELSGTAFPEGYGPRDIPRYRDRALHHWRLGLKYLEEGRAMAGVAGEPGFAVEISRHILGSRNEFFWELGDEQLALGESPRDLAALSRADAFYERSEQDLQRLWGIKQEENPEEPKSWRLGIIERKRALVDSLRKALRERQPLDACTAEHLAILAELEARPGVSPVIRARWLDRWKRFGVSFGLSVESVPEE